MIGSSQLRAFIDSQVSGLQRFSVPDKYGYSVHHKDNFEKSLTVSIKKFRFSNLLDPTFQDGLLELVIPKIYLIRTKLFS